MSIRFFTILIIATLLGGSVAPAATAADLADVGYIDQAAIGSLPVFVNANQQLAAYKAQLDAQFNAQIKKAKTSADKQRVAMAFQQRFTDKQRELIGPLFSRAQLAIAQVSANRSLSVVVDKRIVIFGGQDVTKDVESLFASSQAIVPPSASPPPSEIGFVDHTVLDNVPKVKAANDQMNAYATQQRQIFAPKLAQAKTTAAKQQVAQDYTKAVNDKENQLLKPLLDQTKAATAAAARKKNVLLVVDRADVIYGGTDITTDVQSALGK